MELQRSKSTAREEEACGSEPLCIYQSRKLTAIQLPPPWRPALGIKKHQDRANQQRHWEKLDSGKTSQIDLNYG